MKFRLLFIILVIASVRIQKGDSCTTVNDGCYAVFVCASGSCSQCSSNTQCSSQHTIRTTCFAEGIDMYCVQCSSNSQCGPGKICVTSSWTYMCGGTCTSPTSSCGSGSQCIHLGNQFYCMTCENNIDCHNWSGNSASTCSSGVCSPAFLSCGQDSDCANPTSAQCSSNVCSPCSSSSHCSHLSSTPYCNSGTCVQCLADSDCSSASAAHCSGSNTCVACTTSTQCTHLTSTSVCKTVGGSCVQCLADSDCSSASAAHCSGSNTCVVCTTSTQCTHLTSTPLCNIANGVCVECLLDSDCAGAGTGDTCSSTGVCTACTSSSQCSSSTPTTPICSTTLGQCVQCQTDLDCSSDTFTGQCSSTGTCVACTDSTHCAHFTSTPACDTSSGTCVGCVADSDCLTAAYAQCSSSNTCTTCTDSIHCTHLSSTPVCQSPGSSGLCVECLSDSDCPSNTAAQCSSSSTCVPCTVSSQCTHLSSTPVCNTGSGTCVDCLIDSDCPTTSAAQCSSNTCVACNASSQCAHLSPTSVCSTIFVGVCVECDTDSDCHSTSAAQCSSSGTCVACTDSSNCAHLSSTPLCNTSSFGVCVQCNADTDCSSNAASQCSSSNTCVACTGSTHCSHLPVTAVCKSPGVAGLCVECVSDSDCQSISAAQCSSSNTCVACYQYQSSCYATCPSGTYANSTDYTCYQSMTCKSANDCTANKTYPECNGTTCVACTDDTSCQQWYNQSNMTCNIASGACAAVDPTTQSIATAFSNVASSAVVAIGGVAAISTFAGGSGTTASQGFTTLRITKIGILIRYINIDFPYQTEKIFEAFSSSQSSIKTLLVGVFGDQQYNQTTIDLPTRFVKFGDSSLFLKNAGNTLLLCLLVVMVIVINRILLYWARKKRNRTWIKRLLSLQKILEWNYILGYIMATYPDLIIGLGLQLYNLPFSNLTLLSISSFVICVFIAPFAILFPLICNVLMRAENNDRRRHEYHNSTRYKSLTSDFKENNSDTKTYQMIGLLRIQSMVFPLIFWQSNPQAQILFMIVSSVVVNIFQMGKVPFNSKFTSFVILTNELLLLICMIGVLLHIALNSSGIETNNPKVTAIFGWIIAGVLLSLMSFNLLINVIELLQLAWRGLKSIIFRSKVPDQQRSSFRLSNKPLQSVPPSSLGNTSLNLSQANNALVDNNMSIRIRPRNILPIQ